jgi:hypothetical protein
VIWPTLSTSVPDTTRRRVVEIHSTADELRMLEEGHVIAVHPCDAGSGARGPGWLERTIDDATAALTQRFGGGAIAMPNQALLVSALRPSDGRSDDVTQCDGS